MPTYKLPPSAEQLRITVFVEREGDPVRAICVPSRGQTRKKLARYKCGKCLKGSLPAKKGVKCRMQGCGAVVVDVIRPDRATREKRLRAIEKATR
jgi:hypothetical protein